MGRTATWPDLSVQISRRRLRCVVDPYLCLTERGAELVHGLAGFVWSGMRLVLVHLVVPGRSRLSFAQPGFGTPGEDSDFLAELAPRPIRGVLEGARAFWYDLTLEE